MEVGQVGFHNEKAVKKAKVAKKDNVVINRLNKTKTQSKPDLRRMVLLLPPDPPAFCPLAHLLPNFSGSR
jgi:hypothetical protein